MGFIKAMREINMSAEYLGLMDGILKSAGVGGIDSVDFGQALRNIKNMSGRGKASVLGSAIGIPLLGIGGSLLTAKILDWLRKRSQAQQ